MTLGDEGFVVVLGGISSDGVTWSLFARQDADPRVGFETFIRCEYRGRPATAGMGGDPVGASGMTTFVGTDDRIPGVMVIVRARPWVTDVSIRTRAGSTIALPVTQPIPQWDMVFAGGVLPPQELVGEFVTNVDVYRPRWSGERLR